MINIIAKKIVSKFGEERAAAFIKKANKKFKNCVDVEIQEEFEEDYSIPEKVFEDPDDDTTTKKKAKTTFVPP